MDSRRTRLLPFDIAWFLLWTVASSAWCLSASAQLSSTFDEPFYIDNGLHAWRTGSYKMLLKAGTMPLPVDVETLPLYIWEQFRDRPFDPSADFEMLLPVARAANLVFWWLLLFYGLRLGNLYGGAWGGRLAVLFLACEPNLLAHASLATMDIAVTACLAAFVYHYQVSRQGTWRQRVAIPGLLYGVAMLAKASAMAFVPVAMFALEHHRQLCQSGSRCGSGASLRQWLRSYWDDAALFPADFWKIIGIGFLVAFVYCSSDWQPERSFVAWAEHKLPDGVLKNAMVPVAENLTVFPNAGSGLVYQIKHNIRGHGAYLFGEWYPRAVPYYFPANLLIKLTLPVLGLCLLLMLLRPTALVTPIGLLVLVLLAFSLSCRVQIGIRLILPLVSFLMVTLAIGLVRATPFRISTRWSAVGAVGLAALFVFPPLSVWPDGIRYANAIWGGPENGYRNLSDSNYDWGQGLNDLAAWRRQHGDPPMKVWYYGKDPDFFRAPEICPLHNMPITSPSEFLELMHGRYLAVSTSLLYRDPEFTPQSVIVFSVLRGMTPVARTSTFFIYDFGASH